MEDLRIEISMPKEFEERLFRRIEEVIESTLVKLRLPSNSMESVSTDLISRRKVAELFGVSLTTIDKWRKFRLLPAEIKQGSRVYFPKQALEELLRNKTKFLRDHGSGH